MKRATRTAMGLLALVAMLALGAFSAAVASSHEFIYHGPLPALVLLLSDNTQIFEAVPGSFVVKCPHFRGHILFSGSQMTGKTAKVTGEYPGKCEVTGGSKATISPVEYEINAEGTISVLNTVTITAGSPALCSLLVEPTNNKNLSALLFLKDTANALALLVHAAVGGIHSKGTGSVCKTEENTNGTYFGLILAWAHNGGILWA